MSKFIVCKALYFKAQYLLRLRSPLTTLFRFAKWQQNFSGISSNITSIALISKNVPNCWTVLSILGWLLVRSPIVSSQVILALNKTFCCFFLFFRFLFFQQLALIFLLLFSYFCANVCCCYWVCLGEVTLICATAGNVNEYPKRFCILGIKRYYVLCLQFWELYRH